VKEDESITSENADKSIELELKDDESIISADNFEEPNEPEKEIDAHLTNLFHSAKMI
jgi:hypothetical protein